MSRFLEQARAALDAVPTEELQANHEMMASRAQAAWRKQNVMDGRSGFRLRADWGYVSVLEGGGHICELNLNACDGVNPLWRPPWETIDPTQYARAKHARMYGEPPDGRLLAGIAGHSLSFDHFGPPSPEETAAGLTTHGEAPGAEVGYPEAGQVAEAVFAIRPDAARSPDPFQQETNS